MFKKIFFVAAVAIAPLVMTAEAKADHRCYGPPVPYRAPVHSFHHGNSFHHHSYRSPYSSHYRGFGPAVSPFHSPYRSFYGPGYGYPSYRYGGYGHSGMSLFFGF